MPGDYLLGLNFFWQLDIWRQLRNARDAAGQRYLAAIERRNYFVTRLVAEIAENYYGLMALDKRLENLDQIIELQEQSLKIAKAKKEAARGTELAVQRFQAEVRKNQSEKLIVKQEIIEAENRINFLVDRFPQPVERMSAGFFDLNIHTLSVGVPSQLLQNRPDIRQAERELAAAGLDVKVARANFFPRLDITAGVGYQAFNPKYLFESGSLDLQCRRRPGRAVGQQEGDPGRVPHRERQAIGGRLQLPARHPQRLHRGCQPHVHGGELQQEHRDQEAAVGSRSRPRSTSPANFFRMPASNTWTCSFAQRDLMDARMVLIDTKKQQLSAIVNAYQALGGGYLVECPPRASSLAPATAARPGHADEPARAAAGCPTPCRCPRLGRRRISPEQEDRGRARLLSSRTFQGNKMAFRTIYFALLLSSLPVAGCGTVTNLTNQKPGAGGVSPFGGVKQDVRCIQQAANGDLGDRAHPKSESGRYPQRAARAILRLRTCR